MELLAWHWLIIAAGLLVAELLIPTAAALIWISAGAAIMALANWANPGMPVSVQLLSFGLYTVLALGGWYLFRRASKEKGVRSELNNRGTQLLGRKFELTTDISQGYGQIRVGDSFWQVQGPDLPAGSEVMVVSTANGELFVAPAERDTS